MTANKIMAAVANLVFLPANNPKIISPAETPTKAPTDLAKIIDKKDKTIISDIKNSLKIEN